MRIHFSFTPNTELVPTDYQHLLIGIFHKWIGRNDFHDDISLYSMGWLEGGKALKEDGKIKGFNFPNGARWFISFWEEELGKKLIPGILNDNTAFCGMTVAEIQPQNTPEFGSYMRFHTASPVFIREYKTNPNGNHLLYNNPESSIYLTETLKRKLKKANLNLECSVKFDTTYPNAKTKLINIRGISSKASICPVILEGDPEAVKFAWDVGIGHCTGSTFGSLR